MANVRLPAVLHYLRRAVPASAPGAPADAELVERFLRTRDDAAFEALVRRHAAMVWNVCCRVLRDEHDADDAFQAVFLTLLRKAHTIDRRTSVASWLYKVAYRVALAARDEHARRTAREQERRALPAAGAADELAWRDLRAVLDEELCRLPEKYRAPVVLCYLEGKTNAEAGRQLDCPPGTVVTRLAWARKRLRSRLVRRGITLSAGSLAGALSQAVGTAAVPPRVLDATLRASQLLAAGQLGVAGAATAQALRLSQAAVQALNGTRAKLGVVILASLTLATGGASLLGGQVVSDTSLAFPAAALPGSVAVPPAPPAPGRVPAAPDAGDLGPVLGDVVPPEAGKRPGNELLGFLHSVDPGERTLLFLGDDGVVLKERSLTVAPDAPVTWADRPARLADLKPRCKMILTLAANGSSIVAIRAKAAAPGTPDGKGRTPALCGTLKTVNGRKSVTVTARTDGKDQEHTLELAEAVRVEIDGTPATPADLKPGMAVWLKLSGSRPTVGQILVKG